MEPQDKTQENTQNQQEIQSQDESGSNVSDVKEQAVEKKTGGINKYFILAGILALIITGGIGYRVFLAPESARPVETGVERYITITTNANTWSFNPEFIEADRGDKVILTIINEDDYDHGFAIDAFGISQRMPALSTIQIEFVVTKAGDFPYYCSVSCGSGEVDGEDRGHFDQIGRLHVRSIISETVDYAPEEPATDFAEETRRAAMIQEASRELSVPVEQIQFDAENALWLATGRVLETLENIEYQALYHELTGDEEGKKWVFIDTTTGEVVGTSFDE